MHIFTVFVEKVLLKDIHCHCLFVFPECNMDLKLFQKIPDPD